ncbi:MAG: hypothetical protein QM604_08515 [Microbacterium sp.]
MHRRSDSSHLLRGVLGVVGIAAVLIAGLVGTSSAAQAAAADSVSASTATSGLVQTADLSQFQAGNIISDEVFYDSGALSQSEIQDFLDAKVSSCRSGYTCLKSWSGPSSSQSANAMCSAFTGSTAETAASLIYKVAQACGINPEVLLVMVQKEQGLVTSSAPSTYAYNYAMGYNCPDTTGCTSDGLGFATQVYGGAYMLKRYSNPTGTSAYFTWYAPGNTWSILYNPDTSCGSSGVYIQNQATANLYYYTPYQPNAAALAAGYGTGDSCSAYGNRNFYNYFTDWFGSTQVSDADSSPFGGYNLVVERGQFTVQGWAIDPDETTTALTVSLTVDGTSDWGTFTADYSRPDVGAAYPEAGDDHGMNGVFQIVGGDHTVCVTVRNVGAGSDTSFGCTTISVVTASPYGGTSAEAIAGGVHVTGWTLDTDTTDAIAVHIYVDGVGAAYVANAYRPDVGVVFAGFGDYHGIDVTIPLGVGEHEVCAYGINVGLGFNSLIGCHDVTVTQSGDPVGALDSVVAEPGGFHVTGWAIDPSTTSSIAVHVYRGASGTALTAGVARPDVAVVYPDFGSLHGYDAHIDAAAGTASVCAYGIDVGYGSNSLLGCKSVTVMSGSPFGGIDATVSGGSVRLRGWTIDPDTVSSIAVHVYIDGVGQAITADATRTDVGDVYPGYGSAHGIDSTFSLTAGTHSLCAYGINVGTGSNSLLGCTSVVVQDGSPFGGTDVTVSGTTATLHGWAIDPDTTSPIDVHVYVDGVGTAVTTASASRPDVGAVYPAYGSSHGIDTTFTLTAGTHQICSYGINQGSGSNSLLACQTVQVSGG